MNRTIFYKVERYFETIFYNSNVDRNRFEIQTRGPSWLSNRLMAVSQGVCDEKNKIEMVDNTKRPMTLDMGTDWLKMVNFKKLFYDSNSSLITNILVFLK